MKTIPIEKWGKDHWSTLAFIETLCVDAKGLLSDARRRSLRCNPKRHPALGYWPMGVHRWQGAYGTRLKGFFVKKGTDPKQQIKSHDDWDCIHDFEEADVMENQGTDLNPLFKLTEQGIRYCAAIRRFKANGGNFAQFDPAKHL